LPKPYIKSLTLTAGSLSFPRGPGRAFQVLRRRCEEELLSHIPEPPQSHVPQTQALLKFREQRFDLAPEALGAGISWRAGQ